MIDEKKLIKSLIPLLNEHGDMCFAGKIIGMIDSQTKIDEWIPCSDDNLPKEEVLFYDSHGKIMIGCVSKADEGTDDAENKSEYMYDCVAWQPLPEPYELQHTTDKVKDDLTA